MPVPTLDGSYAMALINIDDSDNENYTVEIRGRRLNAVKVDIPFYKRAK